MILRTTQFFLLVALFLASGAGTLAATSEVVEESAADPGQGATVFYRIRPDLRDCIAPLCGGYFIRPVNRKQMLCADGERRAECYVAAIRWRKIGFEQDHGAELVRGIFRVRNFEGFGELGILMPRAAWRAADQGEVSPLFYNRFEGRWFRVRQTGVVCIAAPCFNIKERVLNRRKSRLISSVDLSQVDALPEEVNTAHRLLQEESLLVVGKNVRIPDQGAAGDGVALVANNFFLPLKAPSSDPLHCDTDADCTTSVYHSPVMSEDDCYCTLCPRPISATAANNHEYGWTSHCGDFGNSMRNELSAELVCPMVLCTFPKPVGCINNQCVELEE